MSRKVFLLSLLVSLLLHLFLVLGPRHEKTEKKTRKTFTRIKLNLKYNKEKPVDTENLAEENNKSLVNQDNPEKKAESSKVPKLSDLGVLSTSSQIDNKLSEGTGEGEKNLNTIKIDYLSFYKRVHDAIKYTWESYIVSKVEQYMQRNHIYEDYVIAVYSMTLDREGNVLKVDVVSSSGYSWYDRIGVESIKKAAPFRNPPKKLIKNGKLTLQWRLIFQLR